MMKRYDLFKVHVPTDEAIVNIRDVFISGFINEGIQVTQLTEHLSAYLGADNLVLVNSCTSALFMALKLSNVGPGDEVISTPMTCVATNMAIAMTGAKIVWADVNPDHGMIDPDDVKTRITSKTKAVIAVAWGGTPPELSILNTLCRGLGIKLILDAAHAFDASYRGKPIHAWAHYTCYSFQAIKHFTTGDGGALVCLDVEDYKRSKKMKWMGIDRDLAKDVRGDWKGQQWDVDIEDIGFKFNMNNVAAAIGLSQLGHIDRILAHHRTYSDAYDSLFYGCGSVYPLVRPLGSVSSSWVYTMKVRPWVSSLQRDDLLKTLNAEGIMAGVVHVPNDSYTAFSSSKVDLPGVREFSTQQFSLPCGWWLDEHDVRHIAARVKDLTK